MEIDEFDRTGRFVYFRYMKKHKNEVTEINKQRKNNLMKATKW